MRHRIDQDCPIAQKAPRNGSVAKKVPKKHGKGKPSQFKLSRILQNLPNNASHSGSDQSDSAQSDSDPKMLTGKNRKGKQISRLIQNLQNSPAHSGSDQSDSAQLSWVPKLVTGKIRRGKQISRLLQTPLLCFHNVNDDECLNTAWAKTWFIFPTEEKIIICYTGCNTNAHRT